MLFLIDAQLPPALRSWLVDQSHRAEHVIEVGLTDADDSDIWSLTCQMDAALLTKDEDLVIIRQRASSGTAVVWLRLDNATNKRLVEWLAKRWPDIVSVPEAGDTIVEVR